MCFGFVLLTLAFMNAMSDRIRASPGHVSERPSDRWQDELLISCRVTQQPVMKRGDFSPVQ